MDTWHDVAARISPRCTNLTEAQSEPGLREAGAGGSNHLSPTSISMT